MVPVEGASLSEWQFYVHVQMAVSVVGTISVEDFPQSLRPYAEVTVHRASYDVPNKKT